MRILLVHNYYGSQSPSGENQVVEMERALLESRGHSVVVFSRDSDEIRGSGLKGMIKGALATPWNWYSFSKMRRLVDSFQPDVVHVHNTFPLISPSIFLAVGNKVACVLTLHNYRLMCPAAIPIRNGNVCTECIDQQSVIPALKHRCYRGSLVATLPLSVSVALHWRLGTWERHVDAFIALSDFQRTKMIWGGLPASRLHVKPNFCSANPNYIEMDERPGYVVFVGRLSVEKGVHTLIRAWKKWGSGAPELRLIGDGILRAQLEQQAKGLPIKFLGQVAGNEVKEELANASLLVLPSECFETFGLVLVEAFAAGTPVAVSGLGPLPDIVENGQNGVVFKPGDPSDLLKEVRKTTGDISYLSRLSKGARQSFDTFYSEDMNYRILTKIYREAIDTNRLRAS